MFLMDRYIKAKDASVAESPLHLVMIEDQRRASLKKLAKNKTRTLAVLDDMGEDAYLKPRPKKDPGFGLIQVFWHYEATDSGKKTYGAVKMGTRGWQYGAYLVQNWMKDRNAVKVGEDHLELSGYRKRLESLRDNPDADPNNKTSPNNPQPHNGGGENSGGSGHALVVRPETSPIPAQPEGSRRTGWRLLENPVKKLGPEDERKLLANPRLMISGPEGEKLLENPVKKLAAPEGKSSEVEAPNRFSAANAEIRLLKDPRSGVLLLPAPRPAQIRQPVATKDQRIVQAQAAALPSWQPAALQQRRNPSPVSASVP